MKTPAIRRRSAGNRGLGLDQGGQRHHLDGLSPQRSGGPRLLAPHAAKSVEHVVRRRLGRQADGEAVGVREEEALEGRCGGRQVPNRGPIGHDSAPLLDAAEARRCAELADFLGCGALHHGQLEGLDRAGQQLLQDVNRPAVGGDHVPAEVKRAPGREKTQIEPTGELRGQQTLVGHLRQHGASRHALGDLEAAGPVVEGPPQGPVGPDHGDAEAGQQSQRDRCGRAHHRGSHRGGRDRSVR